MSGRDLERTFDVGGRDPGRFEEYIRELREDIIRELPSTSRAPPPLPPNLPNDLHVLTREESQGPRQWLRLRMVAPDQGGQRAVIILWIRTDNLYLVGFEQEQPPPIGGGSGRYEFGTTADPNHNDTTDKKKKKKMDKDKNATKKKEKQQDQGGQRREPLIPGASFLGFDGGYDALGLREGEEPNVGYQQLVDAIRGLATYRPGAPGGVGRHHLRTIVVTVSESLRLHNVCRYIGQLLSNRMTGSLTGLLIKYMHNWKAISACVLDSANNTPGDLYTHLRESCQIQNTEQACQVVAMLKNTTTVAVDKYKPGRSRPKREAVLDDEDVPQAFQGLTFVEIFSVVVQGSTGWHNLYGHIAIDDGLTSQRLFMRGRSNALPPSADGHVELTGPARAVWGYDEIVMHVDLMDAIPGAVADMTPDSDEVGSGKLVWNTYDTPRMVYDEVEEYVFEGVSGAVNVRCAVLTNAVVATVVLRRTGTGGGQEFDVYGTVSAATAMFLPRDKVTLFNRERKDAFSMGADEDVPLLRNVAVVPLRSPLVICADLWTRAYVVDMSADDQISSGAVAVFQPSPFGVFRKVISGSDDYEFEVSVTWSLN